MGAAEGLINSLMKRLEDGTLVDLPKVVPPTANPNDFHDHLLKTDHLPKPEVDKLVQAISNYIEE